MLLSCDCAWSMRMLDVQTMVGPSSNKVLQSRQACRFESLRLQADPFPQIRSSHAVRNFERSKLRTACAFVLHIRAGQFWKGGKTKARAPPMNPNGALVRLSQKKFGRDLVDSTFHS